MSVTLPVLVSLALADSINPCAIAVLAFMLIAFMTHNPKKRNKTLVAGFCFIFAVYILYLIYAVLFIGILNACISLASGVDGWIYGLFSLFAVWLGCSNIADFFWPHPGGLLREMPMTWRPKVKKIIEGVATPKGAFFVGVFVTLFLLPCTIGPLVTACVILEEIGILGAIPWLLLYNLIFIIPMIIITLGIYTGLWAVENISEWKNKNVKYLHLTAGIIMTIIGLFMGWEAGNIFSVAFGFFNLNFLNLCLIEIPIIFGYYFLHSRKK